MRAAAASFWRKRSLRERVMLASGAALLTLGVLYAYFWMPMIRDRTRLLADLPAMRVQTQQMRADAREIEGLRGNTRAPADLKSSVIDSIAGQRFGRATPQVNAQSDGSIRVDVPVAQLADWLAWINLLSASQGIRVVSARLDTLDMPGSIRASATLTRDGP